jgi:hypothetical protein
VTTSGDGTGYPWTAEHINDLFALIQGILARASITPNNIVDTVPSSQLLTALFNAEIFGNPAISDVSLSKLIDGASTVTNSDLTFDDALANITLAIDESSITLTNTADSSSLTLKAGTGSLEPCLEYVSGNSGVNLQLDSAGFRAEGVAGTSYQPLTKLRPKGMLYANGPGSSGLNNVFRSRFDVSSLVWTGSGFNWSSVTDVTLTGVPFPPTIIDARITATRTSDSQVFSFPVAIDFKSSGGIAVLDNTVAFVGVDPTLMQNHELFITYDATGVD